MFSSCKLQLVSYSFPQSIFVFSFPPLHHPHTQSHASSGSCIRKTYFEQGICVYIIVMSFLCTANIYIHSTKYNFYSDFTNLMQQGSMIHCFIRNPRHCCTANADKEVLFIKVSLSAIWRIFFHPGKKNLKSFLKILQLRTEKLHIMK